MTNIIWLDDIRNPRQYVSLFSSFGKYKVTWVKSYDEFVSNIIDKLPDVVFFDHDLGLEKSGYDCAKWLIDYCIENNVKPPKYRIQSANPVGRTNIDSLFNSYYKVFGND